jgi:hypothetical protein
MEWKDEDDEDYAGFDTSDQDGDNTDECPHCGELIYGDAERCQECGEYLSREDAPAERKPAWVIVGVAICLVIVLLWVLGGLL